MIPVQAFEGRDVAVFGLGRSGLTAARWVWCECGGHRTMERLFQRYMATGELLAA